MIGEQELPIDWSCANFGSFTSGKGINEIIGALFQHIVTEWFYQNYRYQ